MTVHELPDSEESVSGDEASRKQQLNDGQTMVVNTALVARIRSPEAERHTRDVILR